MKLGFLALGRATFDVDFANKKAEIFLNNLINSGLEHHMELCYDDHREKLEELAFSLKLPILYI